MHLRKVLLDQQEKPPPKKRKVAVKSKEDAMLVQAMSVLAKSKEEPDIGDAFGQSIALNLKSIHGKRTKEFIKYKIQDLTLPGTVW